MKDRGFNKLEEGRQRGRRGFDLRLQEATPGKNSAPHTRRVCMHYPCILKANKNKHLLNSTCDFLFIF